jgi:hypothetical protein
LLLLVIAFFAIVALVIGLSEVFQRAPRKEPERPETEAERQRKIRQAEERRVHRENMDKFGPFFPEDPYDPSYPCDPEEQAMVKELKVLRDSKGFKSREFKELFDRWWKLTTENAMKGRS